MASATAQRRAMMKKPRRSAPVRSGTGGHHREQTVPGANVQDVHLPCGYADGQHNVDAEAVRPMPGLRGCCDWLGERCRCRRRRTASGAAPRHLPLDRGLVRAGPPLVRQHREERL